MLADAERKILRILYNFSKKYTRMPSWDELKTKTGRSREEIFAALTHLETEGYIWFEPPETKSIRIFKSSESSVGTTEQKRHWHDSR